MWYYHACFTPNEGARNHLANKVAISLRRINHVVGYQKKPNSSQTRAIVMSLDVHEMTKEI
jgi:hypothetical protein